MAGGGRVAAYVRSDKRPCQDWRIVSILTKRLVATKRLVHSRTFQNLAVLDPGHLKRHHAFSSNFWRLQAGYCLEVYLKRYSILPIWFVAVTVLSTYVQSLEPSIKRSTKWGLVETGSKFALCPYCSEQYCRFLHSWFPKTGFWNVLVLKCWFSNVSFWRWNKT